MGACQKHLVGANVDESGGGGFHIPIQCCQLAEIPAKKLKRGLGKRKLAGRICGRTLAEFCQKWQKRGRRTVWTN
jgi:hypothetical protein